MKPPVFEDSTGGRRATLLQVLWVSVVALSVVATVFAVSLAVVPLVSPSVPRPRSPVAASPSLNRLHQSARGQLLKLKAAEPRLQGVHAPPTPGGPLAIAFYAPWEDSGLDSFRSHAQHLNIVIPAWLALNANGDGFDQGDFDLTQNPRNKDVIRTARAAGVAIVPLISNAVNGNFDAARLKALLAHRDSQERLVRELREWVLAHGFQGINLDFELLPAGEWPQLSRFIEALATDFHAHHLLVTADLEAFLAPDKARRAVNACDWVVVMAYDEHSEDGAPGPIASLPWVEKIWRKWLTAFPAAKLVVAIGSYGYDWGAGGSESLSFDAVLSTANGYRPGERASEVIEVDPASLNPHFSYDDDNDRHHTVWFLDAITAHNQMLSVLRDDARGVALWVLGNEDPSIWSFFDRRKMRATHDLAALRTVSFPYQIDYVGKGEILQVKERPREGRRRLESDPESQLVTDWSYEEYAFPFILRKSGFQPRQLVLTFDDGPDPVYTRPILQTLQRLHAPAAFFVLGEAAVRYPHLVAEIAAAGHEIGSHTYTHPNLGAVNDRRATLELNATQRAIEAILGRSTRLFRPPYNADSQPETSEEVRPVEIADRLNYIIVGENIDPNDWRTHITMPDGAIRPKTGRDIADSVIREIELRKGGAEEGNIILLHDAGGDRTATVDALKLLIPELRRRGFEFVSLAKLMNVAPAQLMPPVSRADREFLGIDRVVFQAGNWFQSALRWLFLAAICIGLLRAFLVTFLAWRNRRPPAVAEAPLPPVSVLIAAYNEATVIGKTVGSVLHSTVPPLEVIVVDDGSADGTSEAVVAEYGADPRVVLIHKPNGGKASALNAALGQARADIVVCLDADTVLHPDALGLLARHFADPKVAAVAGNVRVGNAHSLLTRWQSVEYTTSQNIDRRAYERLNCITVVPGAIGAWRAGSVRAVGGYSSDTLAEDMDLTWRLRLAGHRIVNEPAALSFTEAPESFSAFFQQRFRWAYGTLQCLWKHRGALGRHGWFGRFALPQLWLFQVVFQILAPLIDTIVLTTLLHALWIFATARASSIEVDQIALARGDVAAVTVSYGAFLVVELVAGYLAYRWERRPALDLWFLFLQRVVYRQVMYGVIWKALARAATGGKTGWGKLRRLGTVQMDAVPTGTGL